MFVSLNCAEWALIKISKNGTLTVAKLHKNETFIAAKLPENVTLTVTKNHTKIESQPCQKQTNKHTHTNETLTATKSREGNNVMSC